MSAQESPFLPFALPDIGEAEIAEVVDSLRSGWITTGPKTKRFEQAFCDFLGGDVEAIAVNSATAGLHLALDAIGVGPGDEVVTTTHTFTATAEVVRYMGADPVFVDIDPETISIDPDSVERAITARTKAILPVHYGGRACDITRLADIAKRSGLRIIEDAAHALPTTHRGRLVGTLESDATVFSFYATKTLATGEGGMLVTRDPTIVRRARIMRLHGIDRDAFDRYVSKKPAWQYEVVAPGFKYNMTDIAASLGIHQLARVKRFQQRRHEMAARYTEEFRELPLRTPLPPDDDDTHAWHLYVIRLLPSAEVSRDKFIERMAAQGVGCSVHFIPLHQHPYWRDRYQLTPDKFPHSQAVFESSVSLPIYTRMSDDDQTRVIEAVKSTLS